MITINPRLDSQEVFGFLGGELYYNCKVSDKDKDTFKKLIRQYYLPKLEQVLHKDEPDILKEALIDELFAKFSALKLSHYENSDFEVGYKQNYFGKVQGSIDFVIKKDGGVACIFETKKPNSSEMISANNGNTTALHESILYYLREKERAKEQGHRFEVKYIIITDFYQFFFFKEREFDRFFYQNDYIKSLYDKHKALFKDSDLAKERDEQIRNKDFYKMLSEYLQSNDFSAEMKPLYLDLRKFENDDFADIKPFFKAFAPEFLLSKYIHKSEINEAFYKELLYILGLKTIESGKDRNKIIPNNVSGALYENIAESLHSESDKTQENIISLIILWLNRILFLKLIEANLMRFNSSDKNSVRFLNNKNIKDFQTLEKLFFEVLAKPHDERVEVYSPFYYLPYLNSSLFSPNKIEQKLIFIQNLSNDKELLPYKEFNKTQKSTAKIPLLRYLLDFLDSYDFGSGDEYETDTLINASILGNVFERLNAYKEGSFYTPNLITNYMCDESLKCVILNRFNSANPKWQCKNLDDIKDEIQREKRNSGNRESIKQKYKDFLKTIRICDPAVGSGHFLVSALNQMIKIHYDFGLLSNDILNKELSIVADEIHISDFAYAKPKRETEPSHKIQKELFNLKKSIIQNNLFGVDINPNSVEICKLRLWIELLKNSYYLMQSDESYSDRLDSRIHQMQTLPNIDINIKCGNSLISNIALDITKERLESQLKTELNKGYSIEQPKELEREAQSTLQDLKNKLPKEIERYKEATKLYINETNEKIRATHKRTAESARHFILTLFVKTSNEYATFKRVLAHYLESYGYSGIDDATMPNSADLKEWQSKLNTYLTDFNYHKTLNIKHESSAFVEKDFIALVKAMKSYESFKTQAESYFEWRFEFPEVLDSNGDFMGFDLIVGNPPYGVDLSADDRQIYKNIYNLSSTNTAQLFILLADKITSPNGINTFIVPKSLVYVAQWKPLRDMLQPNMFLLTDCGKAWSYVLLEMVIYAVHRNHKCDFYANTFLDNSPKNQTEDDEEIAPNPIIMIDKNLIDLFGLFINNLSQKEIDLGVKIRHIGDMLGKYCENTRGVTYQNKLTQKGKYGFIGGKEINRYAIKQYKGFVKSIKNIPNNAIIKDNALLVQNIVTQNRIVAMLPQKQNAYLLDTINQLVFKKLDSRFVWAILNSTAMNWYIAKFIFSNAKMTMHFDAPATDKIPIPKLNAKNKKIVDKIINLVDEILELKAKDSQSDTTALESQINDLIYKLYDLDSNDTKTITE